MAATLFIGTSGWNYPEWRDTFYAQVPRKNWLRFNASRFDAVEINATFYGSQRPETFRNWRDQVPPRFRFTMKGNRYLTHTKRLLEPDAAVRRERDHARALGDRLAAVVWQLPANLHCDEQRLAGLLRALGHWRRVRHVIEFRHRSWFRPQVARALCEHRVAVCISDAADWPMWDQVTTDLVYVRLHGHTRTYASRYARRSLTGWAERIERWLAEQRQVHVYFDNSADGHAPADALRLRALLAERR